LIVGPGWAFLGLAAIGLAALVLLSGCGLIVVDDPSSGRTRLAAPALVDADPAVEARAAGVWTVSLGRARKQVRRGVLRVKAPRCDGTPSGSGFALDSGIVLAQADVLPGAGTLKVAPRRRPAKPFGATHVYRLGELGIARVDGRLPRRISTAPGAALGASVAVVGYPLSASPRLLRGVVVDRVAGAPFGVRGRVLRLTAPLRRDEPGGPVIDAKGRLVAVAFTTDPTTGLAVAVPLDTLRSLVAARALEVRPPCDGT
jgi:S1-C subfamily serine protease